MFNVGYYDHTEFVVLGMGKTVALAMRDAASTLVDDQPVTCTVDATELLGGLLFADNMQLVVTWVPQVTDPIAAYKLP